MKGGGALGGSMHGTIQPQHWRLVSLRAQLSSNQDDRRLLENRVVNMGVIDCSGFKLTSQNKLAT